MIQRAEPVIAVQDLCVDRGNRRVLEAISLEIPDAQAVAIVGPNGAGKSTLMLAMAGMLPAARGRVVMRGTELARWRGRRAIAREIAYVPQQYEGFTGFTVDDMVASARYPHLGRLSACGAPHRRIIDEAMAACDVIALRGRIFSSLSGGERQKVHLAAAVAQQSPVLMLDEPASALDPKHQSELVSLLRRLRGSGRTLVVICHDLNLAAALDARIVALRAGRLLFSGGLDAFLAGPHLQAAFDAEFVQLRTPDGRTRILPSF